jgi:hypothetical protein
VRWPSDAAENFTVIVQLPCVATGVPMQELLCEKSPGFEPLNEIALTCKAVVPEFIT